VLSILKLISGTTSINKWDRRVLGRVKSSLATASTPFIYVGSIHSFRPLICPTGYTYVLLLSMYNILNQCLLDDMGARIDELELSINDLKAEMGSDGMTPTKVKDEESKPAGSSA
jgi:hypothetical protein